MNEQEIQELYKAFVECFEIETVRSEGENSYYVNEIAMGGLHHWSVVVKDYVYDNHLILKAIKQYCIDICWYGRDEDKEDICRVTGYSIEQDKCAFTEAGNDLDLLVMQAVVAINKYEKANAHDKA